MPRCNHPNLVSVFDTATDDEGGAGRPWSTWRASRSRRPCAAARCGRREVGEHGPRPGRCARPRARAGRGVRDVKPANVLITQRRGHEAGRSGDRHGVRPAPASPAAGPCSARPPTWRRSSSTAAGAGPSGRRLRARRDLGSRRWERQAPARGRHAHRDRPQRSPPRALPTYRDAWAERAAGGGQGAEARDGVRPRGSPGLCRGVRAQARRGAGTGRRSAADHARAEDRQRRTGIFAPAPPAAPAAAAPAPGIPSPLRAVRRRRTAPRRPRARRPAARAHGGPGTSALARVRSRWPPVFIALAIATVGGERCSPAAVTTDLRPPGAEKPSLPRPRKPQQEGQAQGRQHAQGSTPAAPEEEQSSSGSYDPARGAALNDEGFNLMSQGRYERGDPEAPGGRRLLPARHGRHQLRLRAVQPREGAAVWRAARTRRSRSSSSGFRSRTRPRRCRGRPQAGQEGRRRRAGREAPGAGGRDLAEGDAGGEVDLPAATTKLLCGALREHPDVTCASAPGCGQRAQGRPLAERPAFERPAGRRAQGCTGRQPDRLSSLAHPASAHSREDARRRRASSHQVKVSDRRADRVPPQRLAGVEEVTIQSGREAISRPLGPGRVAP